MNDLNRKQALGSFFDQAAAAKEFNDQFHHFFTRKHQHAPAEVKEWLNGTLNTSFYQRLRLANEAFLTNITDMSAPVLEDPNLKNLSDSCDSINEYYLFDKEAYDIKMKAYLKEKKVVRAALKAKKKAGLQV